MNLLTSPSSHTPSLEEDSSKALNYQSAFFITSAPSIKELPSDTGMEVAFAGRSNAGKSTALNVLCRQKNLAKTSKTPGRTQLINLFQITEDCHLVDLPGYGYAQVPLEVKKKWQRNLSEYLQKRQQLKGLVVLMDIRHPMKDIDQQMIYWAVGSQLPVLVLLTKADKLKNSARKQMVLKIQEAALAFCGDVQVEPFSALSNIGVDKLTHCLTRWFSNQTQDNLLLSDNELINESIEAQFGAQELDDEA